MKIYGCFDFSLRIKKSKQIGIILTIAAILTISLYGYSEEDESANLTDFYSQIRGEKDKNEESTPPTPRIGMRSFLEGAPHQNPWVECEAYRNLWNILKQTEDSDNIEGKQVEETDSIEEELQISEEKSYLAPYLWALRSWDRTKTMDVMALRARKKQEERGIDLPMNSNLKIDGYKSVRVEYNHTHYFGRSDANKFYGLGYGSSSYSSGGLDFGFSDYSYDSGGYGNFGSSYGSSYGGGYSSYGSSYGGGYSSYGRYGTPRASGINIEQELQVGLHGRIGKHTHVSVDYSDRGSDYYSSFDNKEQKIRVWYEGDENSIIKRVAFGDIMLSLPNSRFLSVNRNLFGIEAAAEVKGINLIAFGSRSKGIKERRRFRGESRRSGYGTGNRIADVNYVKERYYAIYLGEDGDLHEAYLPIKTGSEVIYVDDGNGSNNQGGYKTARGYFNQLFPGQDYNIDYQKGEIEFLTQISARYKMVVAYEYLGDGSGMVGNITEMFADENENGIIDEEDDPTEIVGYVVIKDANFRGTELRNVYSLGNRNLSRQDFELSIWRAGGADSFEISEGERVPYIQIFGLDQNGDAIVDPEYIDFERGVLMFPSPRPFAIDDPNSPYYSYRDKLNNEVIYAENPRYGDQIYTIVADYSYREESYNVGLFVIPNSETVRVGGRKLRRDVDYQMIYEVGSITFFTELNEYDDIDVEFERTPFGGALQQTVAGIWAEYSYKPKPKQKKIKKPTANDQFEQLAGVRPDSQDADVVDDDDRTSDTLSDKSSFPESRYRSSYDDRGYSSYGSSSRSGGYDSYSSYGSNSYSSYGGSGGYDSYGSGYGGYGGYSGSSYRSSSSRRQYGIGSSSFNPQFAKGLHIAAGYIYNTGSKPSRIPNVNEAPSQLQAFDINTRFGHTFNLARIFNPLPLIESEQIPFSIDFSGETAYSHNNPNSVGLASIDSMEGAKDTANIPTYKYNWQISSRPLDDDITQEDRVVFHIIPKDEEKGVGNYMKNREVPASTINPLARPTEERLVMEIGYYFTDIVATWGGLSYGLSASGADYSDKEFLEMWLRVKDDDRVTLHLDIGSISEDTDEDSTLDSEDLPRELTDVNGDRRNDVLDLSLDDLPPEHKYKANGSLDSGEDIGWLYDSIGRQIEIGRENTVLDTEDLNGDNTLDTIESYFELTIPLNDIPEEWIKRRTKNDWLFISIPLKAASTHGGREPNWGFVKHIRLWLEKNGPGTVTGTLEWASIELVGNQWERGVITNEQGVVITNTSEKFLVGTKDNYDFKDYLDAYEDIKDDKLFEKLHPYVETGFGFGTTYQRERSLTLAYILEPGSTGVTSRNLKGARYGDGQDFSKHQTLRFWLHGDKSGATFVMRLGSSMRTGYRSYSSYRSYGPFDTQQPEEEPNIFENIKDYYEYTTVIDFDGWKLIEIPLTDEDGDNQPDGLVPVSDDFNKLSITNIGGVLLGLKNETNRELSGEVWVNEIHLADPLIRTGWARRGNFSAGLGRFFNLRGGYSDQDKDFENTAGQTSRRNMMSRGYSTSTYDANIDAQLRIFQWLPISYSIRKQESETESRYGTISTYNSGRSRTRNRSLGVQFNLRRFPQLSFDYDKQNFWNERRGDELSDLYSGSFNYDLGSKFSIDTEYQHESVTTDPSTADPTATSSSYYSSYSRGDEIIDSGSISLRITPIASLSLNPIYDVRRELEKRETTSSYSIPGQTTTSTEEPQEPEFTLASREHRLSLTPRLNRDFFGIRPSISNRVSFRENWWGGQKDASLNANIRLGVNIRPKAWFGYGKTEGGRRKAEVGRSGGAEISENQNPEVEQQKQPAEPTMEVGSRKTEDGKGGEAKEQEGTSTTEAPSDSETKTEGGKGKTEDGKGGEAKEQKETSATENPSDSESKTEDGSQKTEDGKGGEAEKQEETSVITTPFDSETELVETADSTVEPTNPDKQTLTTPKPPQTVDTVGLSSTGETKSTAQKEDSVISMPASSSLSSLPSSTSGIDSFEAEQRAIERRERELDRLKRYGVDEEDIERMEEERGDWISRDKSELDRKIRERKQMGEKAEMGIWRRSIESFAINFDVSFDARDYLRKLDHGESLFDILKLPDDSDKRSRSTIGRRYGFRANIDPLSWASFGTSLRFNNDFTKSAGTSSRYKSNSYEGNTKIFSAGNASSFQIRYQFSNRNRTSVTGTSISKSKSHEPSFSWRQSWSSGTKTSTGVRFTRRNQTHSGVKSNSMIITPNFSVDYRLYIKGEWRAPILNKVIALDHNFDLSNTFSTVIRREQFGVNRDEKSERFETSLRVNYNLSTHLRMNMNLGISYNNDHVEEGRDYFSIASSIMVRGEFR